MILEKNGSTFGIKKQRDKKVYIHHYTIIFNCVLKNLI